MADALAPDARHSFVHQGRTVYEWDQTLTEVNLYIEVPAGVKAKELDCKILQKEVKVGIKGNPPYLQGHLSGPVRVDESFWTLDGTSLVINLQKAEAGQPWPCVFVGHELDPSAQQEDTQRLMLERFQKEHPGFDFSGATFNGQAPNPRTFMGGPKLP